jgi:hypothetical protein
MRILIVGGYGTFGGRLARLLVDERLTLIVAGRSLESARRFCASLRGKAEIIPAQFDRARDVDAQLERLAPTLVVDASGPFQAYGNQPYRLIEACLTRCIHYVDLADGADFVAGIPAFDAQAKARGMFVLSGASTCPVLTAGVVKRLVGDDLRLESVAGGIAPSPFAGVGLNVIRAIAQYAGEPIRARRDGRETTAYGLCERRWVTIAPPGAIPLRSRIFSLIDVPDTHALPDLWPSVQEIWMSAAPVPIVFHRLLIVLSKLRRVRLIPAISRIAPLMHSVTTNFSWGEHRGGMFVTVQATERSGARIEKSWYLIAEGDSGPFIPSMAAAAIVRKLLAGERIEPGARNAIHDVELSDNERLFAPHAIVTGVRETRQGTASIFERLLGDLWPRLPEPLRAMHRLGAQPAATGVARVERGRNVFAKLLAAVIGLPRAGADIALSVRFARTPTHERWTRRFADQEFHSDMNEGQGREAGLLIERFGPFSLAMALVWEDERLKFVIRRWRLGPLVLPLWLAPISTTHETVADDRFNFDVGIALPLIGLVVRYRGWLVAKTPE